MESWHEPLTLSNFNIKIYLDTNILCFYLDNEYPSLNKSMDFLRNSEFATLVSSEIVLLELVSIRKRLLYLRAIKDKFPGKFPEESAELIQLNRKIRNYEDFPDFPYKDVKDEIKEKVLEEINNLRELYPKIEFEKNTFHNEIYEPCANLILSTNFSRADSLVLISALLPEPAEPEDFIYLVTKDGAFIKEYNNIDLISLFNELNLAVPMAERITNIRLRQGAGKDFTKAISNEEIESFWNHKIKEILIQKNSHLFFGQTYLPHNLTNTPVDCIDFRLNPTTPINQNLTLIIIGRDLDFVYNVKIPPVFWNNTEISHFPFISNRKQNISFRSLDYDGNNIVSTKTEVITRLREKGHLVFAHPFSFE